MDMFVLFFKNFNKPTSKITKTDLQTFKDALVNDHIKKTHGVYSQVTKEDMTGIVCRYLETRYPKKIILWSSSNGKPFRKWFLIHSTKKTPEILSEAEIEKLYNASKTIEGKFLIAILFDSGCRIEEFLNIRFEDIEAPTTNFPYYKIDLREEYSKTSGRKIGLYWKHSTEAMAKYLQICDNKEYKAKS